MRKNIIVNVKEKQNDRFISTAGDPQVGPIFLVKCLHKSIL